MDEEIEDLIGDVKLSDSQKSVATSILYSMEFTDSSSDKNNSSGKDTYVIDIDTEDSDSSHKRTVNINDATSALVKVAHNHPPVNRSQTTQVQRYSMVSQEIFTQTSKTIIELAEHEGGRKFAAQSSLETQTSFVSISENKTVEYTVEFSSPINKYSRKKVINENSSSTRIDLTCNHILSTLEDKSSVLESITENGIENRILSNSDEFGEDETYDSVKQIKKGVDLNDSSVYDSDFEEDSLMKESPRNNNDNDSNDDNSDFPNSVDNEVEELYSKLSNCFEIHVPEKHNEKELRRIEALTPLTEESIIKKESLIDVTPMIDIPPDIQEADKEFWFSNNSQMKLKQLPRDKEHKTTDHIKLPPISNNSHPTTPKSYFVLVKDGPRQIQKARTLSSLFVCQKEIGKDRWELNSKNLASGEGNMIHSYYVTESERRPNNSSLPPIQQESNKYPCSTISYPVSLSKYDCEGTETTQESICISESIRELKNCNADRNESKSFAQHSQSRSGSPRKTLSCDQSILEIAERGCDALCIELLKRLHSHAWLDVAETLDDLPKQLDKFWRVISEGRIADLIRQVLVHVESPRTQLAKAACSAIASLLKNTNYTKKPDFYEAMTILLTKTGSYSRPVRRAANIALDEIVSGVDHTQAVTALCIHGVRHKSPEVRASAARLLVVSAALAGGGRGLLRARPPSAAAARRLAHAALAALLDDRSTHARKYAERFYQMLRPLPNFEAYFLNDVDVETATRHMKKYDQLLRASGVKEAR